ncbi:hypothetical protein [Aestuariimicrobium ganziense]|uniref:hypothetical protein n=1 Tax=Aestuariimicrobium ganziense TaxID=2773677 RepID=UPI0019458BDE|nr:hypothetical protein [Aestuariimicrobium ganziense]
MNSQPRGLFPGTELWLQWADPHGVRHDDDGKSFNEVARDYQTSHANSELLAPDPSGSPSATHQAAASTAYARALLIVATIEHRGGDLDVYPVQVCDSDGRIVARRSSPDESWESFAGPTVAPDDPGALGDQHGAGVPAVTEPELPLPDVPLIVEDLLVEAKQLADAGAPPEVIEKILDQVDPLREGRG